MERKKYDDVFNKFLAIASPQMGDMWFQKIKKLWDTTETSQMLLEKFHKLVLAHVDDE